MDPNRLVKGYVYKITCVPTGKQYVGETIVLNRQSVDKIRWYSQHQSEETRRKIGDAHRGKVMAESTKAILREKAIARHNAKQPA